MLKRLSLIFIAVCVSLCVCQANAAKPKKGTSKKTTKSAPAKSEPEEWEDVYVDNDLIVSYNLYYDEDRNGNQIIWVKTVFQTEEWQWRMAQQAGLNTPVAYTKTKVMYTPDFFYSMVRQVICYNKDGKRIYNTGDDRSAGWYPMDSTEPIGMVGEYLRLEECQ